MKLKITETVNRHNAMPLFQVYTWKIYDWCKEGRWDYLSSFSTIEKAREYVSLQVRLGDAPLPEKLVEEFEG